LLFLVGTRAMSIVVGVMILSIAYFGALLAKFTMISALLSYVFTFGAFAAVVVFQPELRNALARLGQSRLMRRFSQSERQSVAEEIAEAMDRLSRAGTGAIIAVEGDIGLEEFISSGVPMEAKVSGDLAPRRRRTSYRTGELTPRLFHAGLRATFCGYEFWSPARAAGPRTGRDRSAAGDGRSDRTGHDRRRDQGLRAGRSGGGARRRP